MAETDEPRPYSTPDPKNPVLGPQKWSPRIPPRGAQISFFRTKNPRYPHATEKNDFFFTKTVTHPFFWTNFFRPRDPKNRLGPKNSDPNASIDPEKMDPKMTSRTPKIVSERTRGWQTRFSNKHPTKNHRFIKYPPSAGPGPFRAVAAIGSGFRFSFFFGNSNFKADRRLRSGARGNVE